MTKLFKQEEIDEASEKFDKEVLLGNLTTEYCFKAGVEFAESKVEEIAVEFADWLNIHEEGFRSLYREKNSNTPIYWVSCYTGGRIDYTSKELFQQFIKERNE